MGPSLRGAVVLLGVAVAFAGCGGGGDGGTTAPTEPAAGGTADAGGTGTGGTAADAGGTGAGGTADAGGMGGPATADAGGTGGRGTADAGGTGTGSGVSLFQVTVELRGDGTGRVTSNNPKIDCPPTCTALYPFGSIVLLSATPDQGSFFGGWSGAGCFGTGQCAVVIVLSDVAVVATFGLKRPTTT